MKILIENGANPNVCDENGNTPLMLACARLDARTADTLLSLGADIDRKNKKGLTAADLKRRSLELKEVLSRQRD